MSGYNVAVVGSGAVGKKILELLEERNFPVNELKILATKRSAGKEVMFAGKKYIIQKTTPESFENVDIALFAGGAASKEFGREAVKRGAIIIDNSSNFRLDPEVPLVVPEVNSEELQNHKGIIANPNCSTIQMVAALKPIYDAAGIKRIVVSTYQAVSGSGNSAIEELIKQAQDILNGEEVTPEAYPHQIAFNVLPHIDVFMKNDYSKEEMKMVNETQKILGDDKIKITATAVRVPVINGHAEAVNIETEKKLTVKEARDIFESAPGIIVEDNLEKNIYPMPINCDDSDKVFVGRIREDYTIENGLNIWITADNLRKGAATNAIQIAENLIKKGLV